MGDPPALRRWPLATACARVPIALPHRPAPLPCPIRPPCPPRRPRRMALPGAMGALGWVAGGCMMLFFFAVTLLSSHMLLKCYEVDGITHPRYYEAVADLLGAWRRMPDCWGAECILLRLRCARRGGRGERQGAPARLQSTGCACRPPCRPQVEDCGSLGAAAQHLADLHCVQHHGRQVHEGKGAARVGADAGARLALVQRPCAARPRREKQRAWHSAAALPHFLSGLQTIATIACDLPVGAG